MAAIFNETWSNPAYELWSEENINGNGPAAAPRHATAERLSLHPPLTWPFADPVSVEILNRRIRSFVGSLLRLLSMNRHRLRHTLKCQGYFACLTRIFLFILTTF